MKEKGKRRGKEENEGCDRERKEKKVETEKRGYGKEKVGQGGRGNRKKYEKWMVKKRIERKMEERMGRLEST